jgi:hypothetical protein
VLDRALDALIGELEKRKFAACKTPRIPRPSSRARHIPAEVLRAVRERDGGQCTFESDSGHRCNERRFVEFDHIEPVARGGRATVEGMRLRCRTHNQLEAERTFGAGFMQSKRPTDQHAADLMAGLRNLGVRADVAKQAIQRTAALQNATLEERMREVLKYLRPRTVAVSMG